MELSQSRLISLPQLTVIRIKGLSYLNSKEFILHKAFSYQNRYSTNYQFIEMQQKYINSRFIVFIDLNWAMGLNIILFVVPKYNYGILGLLCVSLNKNFGRHKNILMTNCQFFADPRQSDVSQPGEYPPCSFAVGWFINHKVGSDEMTEIQTENSFYNLVPFKYQPPEDLKRMYRSLNFFYSDGSTTTM